MREGVTHSQRELYRVENDQQTKASLERARDLIKAKRYDEARAILQPLDHPLAEQWLHKLDAVAPQSAPQGEVADWLQSMDKPSA